MIPIKELYDGLPEPVSVGSDGRRIFPIGHRRWNEEETCTAVLLLAEGFELDEVAELVDRTPAAVYQRLGQIGLPVRTLQKIRTRWGIPDRFQAPTE